MRRFTLAGAAGVGLLLLVGFCFGPAIAGRQFSYRDAAHFYYPLYQRVQTEWEAGRWPLWEPEENAGMPLLGNPTAAVLYPGKLIYTVLPYPLAARVYIIAHTLLAFAGTVLLARSLGIGTSGSVAAGFGYAFGAPILFQYCNIIYLVGAAWVPFGLRAIDAWLRLGRRSALIELAIVLAMQVLGGDPQAAYLEGLCGGAYALILARGESVRPKAGFTRKLLIGLTVTAILAAWVGITLWLAYYLPQVRPNKPPPPPQPTFPWNKYVPLVVAGVWGVWGLRLLFRWRKGRTGASILGGRLSGLAGAAILAGLLASAQLLPIMEFSSLIGRNADEGTHDIYPFSLEPYRVVEMAWPGFFGTFDRGNHLWINLIPPVASHKAWVPSLYFGGILFVLALAGMGFREGPRWRSWLTAITLVSLIAAMGEFVGPIWIARWFDALIPYIGPHDTYATNAIRQDGFLRNGDGSFYHLLSTVIPGFQQFRYPSKLLTFTVMGMALLAGYGWDRVLDGKRRRVVVVSGLLIGLSVVFALVVQWKRADLLAYFEKERIGSAFGPLESPGAFADLRNSLLYGIGMFGLAIVGSWAAVRRPKSAAICFVLVVAGDLAYSNRRLVFTADQSEFEGTPKVLQLIADAEKKDPAPGPFRIHRMPIWNPEDWRTVPSTERVNDFLRWERATIQPKYGLPFGIKYTFTQGVAEIYDYEWFFGPFERKIPAQMASALKITDLNEPIVYYPRRAFDLWNTRYFVLPGRPIWGDPDRGIASFITQTEAVYPEPGRFKGVDGAKRQEEWIRSEDFQILRNKDAYPRAWVVHDARFSEPIEGLTRALRKLPMEEMLYANDEFWHDPTRIFYDPKTVAWVEVADRTALTKFLGKGKTSPKEKVVVREPNPRRVELDVDLDRPGIVVLADVYYPGWTLTIDGKPSEFFRANRLMRGAAVEAGPHTLVYEYRPRSFLVGGILSGIGFLMLPFGIGWARSGRKSLGLNRPKSAD